MTDLVLFHHVLGLTRGFTSLGERLTGEGVRVHTPDLFEGRTFPTIEEGIAFADTLDQEDLIARGKAATDRLEPGYVLGGTSMGTMIATALAARDTGVAGVLSLESFVDPKWFDGWDRPIPLQIHGMEHDPYFDEDLPAAREWVDAHDEATLFVYPGDVHLFTDSSTPQYDAAATDQVVERARAFLAGFQQT